MFYLSETQKIVILIFATSLFLLSVFVTICVVSPICLLNKWLFGNCKKSNLKENKQIQQLITPESKHFQLTVVPHYGTSQPEKGGNSSAKSNRGTKSIKSLLSGSSGSNKKSSEKSETQKKANKQIDNLPKIKLSVYWDQVNDNTIKLHVTFHEVIDLLVRGHGLEPSCFVEMDLFHSGRFGSRRKSFNKAATSVANYKTKTAKRCLNPCFNETFTSNDLPSSVLYKGQIRIKVMDDERYANDYSLGEVIIPLKQFADINSKDKIQSFDLHESKEYKGELLIGLCYLPTSKRITVTVIKATVNTPASGIPSISNFYVRVLMFVNGKLSKKKRTATSDKLMWGDNETLTFDLTSSAPDETNFMIVLSSSSDVSASSISSPSSPESPDTPESNGSRKDKHCGHFIIGQEFWSELKLQPRKQITKWVKLF